MRSILLNLTICFLIGTASAAIPCNAAVPNKKLPPTKSPLVLGEVDGETFDQMTVINIRFSENPTWETPPQVEDHGMFLQITLPETIVTEPGKFFDGAPPHFPKIAIIQTTAQDAAVRIFTTKPASVVRESSKTEILGNRLIMTLDHKKLETNLISLNTPQAAEAGFVGPPVPTTKSSVTAESIIGSTIVRTDLAAPSLVLKKEGASKLVGGASELDLRGKLTKVAIFSGVMFLLLIGSWLAKPFVRRNRRNRRNHKTENGNSSPLSFETVASMALSPRQKLMVVQIGNERVLLGVGQDSISFLTNLTHSEAVREAMPSSISKVLPSFGAKKFEETLVEQSVDLFPRPQLKNIEGNDAESLAAPEVRKPIKRQVTQDAPVARATKPESTPKRTATQPGSRLNIRIDDNGATRVVSKATVKKEPEPKKQAIDDITSIIREKLNTLRAI